MTNGPIITEPGPVDSKTGTRRLDVWRESTSGGQWGDQAIAAGGYGFTSRYVSDDEYGCAEVAVYPVLYEDGSYGVEEMSMCGRSVRDDPDGPPRPSDDAEISYEGGSALAFDTLEAAEAEAERLARRDWSFAIYLRRTTA